MQLLRLEDFYVEEGPSARKLPPSKAGEMLPFAQLKGRLCEFSSIGTQGVASLAARYVWEAQQAGWWPVWVSRAGLPLAEDLQACGVDLRALPMVRTQTVPQALRAAERVMRSALCGVVVIDLGRTAYVPAAMMGRMLKLAQRTDTACLVLSNRNQRADTSCSPLVSLRMNVAQERVQHAEITGVLSSRMEVHSEVVRDKTSGRRDRFTLHYAACAGAG